MPVRFSHPAARAALPRRRRPMPLRHKLMLALACEIVLLGLRQAHLDPRHAGIVIEIPDHAHHVVT